MRYGWHRCGLNAYPTFEHGQYMLGAGQGAATLDSANEKFAAVFLVQRAGEVKYVWWRKDNSTAGTNPLVLTLETVGSDGLPTGTLFDASCTGTDIIIDGTNNYAAQITDISAGATCTVAVGDLLAVVLTNPATNFPTLGVGGMTTSGPTGLSVYSTTNRFPYGATNTGSWAKQVVYPQVILEYDDGELVPLPQCELLLNGSGATYSIASNGTYVYSGNAIEAPFGMRVVGMQAKVYGTADFKLVLFDAAGARLRETPTMTPNYRGSTSATASNYALMFTGGPLDLPAGTRVYAMIEATSITAQDTFTYQVRTRTSTATGDSGLISATEWVQACVGASFPFTFPAVGRIGTTNLIYTHFEYPAPSPRTRPFRKAR